MMHEIHVNEIVNLMLYFGVLIFVLANFKRLKQVPVFGLLMAAAATLMISAVLTVVEGAFPVSSLGYMWFNRLEHCGYACCSGLLALWCRFLCTRGGPSS